MEDYDEAAMGRYMAGQKVELVNEELGEARERYHLLLESPAYIEEVLQQGATKAREYSKPLLANVRQAVGIYSFT